MLGDRKQTCLDYAESGTPDEVGWDSILKNRAESQEEMILALVRQGVPKQRRGEIWKFFSKAFNRFIYSGPLDLNAPIFKGWFEVNSSRLLCYNAFNEIEYISTEFSQ